MAETYSRLPSELVGCETDLGAWALNESCLIVGRQTENALQNGDNPFKRIGSAEAYKSAATNAKKIKLPDNGIW